MDIKDNPEYYKTVYTYNTAKGQHVTDSRIVAHLFGYTHVHFMRRLERLLHNSVSLDKSNFILTTYTSSINKKHALIQMTEKGYSYVVRQLFSDKKFSDKVFKYNKIFDTKSLSEGISECIQDIKRASAMQTIKEIEKGIREVETKKAEQMKLVKASDMQNAISIFTSLSNLLEQQMGYDKKGALKRANMACAKVCGIDILSILDNPV